MADERVDVWMDNDWMNEWKGGWMDGRQSGTKQPLRKYIRAPSISPQLFAIRHENTTNFFLLEPNPLIEFYIQLHFQKVLTTA